MIDRYTLTQPPDGIAPRWNIAPLQMAPVRVGDRVQLLRWGLLPRWKGHGGKRAPMIVSVAVDELGATPLVRDAFEKSRALALADGWFAWRKIGKQRQPYWIHPAGAFAAIVATNKDDGVASFAIITCPADAAVAPIGPTMPLVAGDDYLASASLVAPEAAWRADAVSTYVNAVEHDDPRCVEPLGNPAQGELF